MTLDTRFLVTDPVAVDEVWTFARDMIGATDETTYVHDREPRYWPNPLLRNDADQGLPALLYVHYGADGPLLDHVYDDEGVHEVGVGPHEPGGFVLVSLDTAYGYQGPGGLGCGELHAGYVAQLGRWCEDHGLGYAWCNEFTGEWFTDWRNAADELGRSGEGARDWWAVIRGALEAEYGEVMGP